MAFLAGAIITSLGNNAFADDKDKGNPLQKIVQAINSLTTVIQNKETNVNVNVPPAEVQVVNKGGLDLLVAATNTGEALLQSAQVLFYGEKLCRIAGGGGIAVLIEFGGETLVQHNNALCPEIYGNSRPIELKDGSDHTFHKGDRLILALNPGPNWNEVSREIVP